MRFNILVGGKAGQGINKVSEILSRVFTGYGYFIFNYRDYQSLIRGGHNFNVLSVSDEWIGSHESKVDLLVALDDETLKIHNKDLKKGGTIFNYENFEGFGRNLNIALCGAVVKIFGIDRDFLTKEIKKDFESDEILSSAEKGYDLVSKKFEMKRLDNKIKIMTGSAGSAMGAVNSGLDIYINYPMTPATGIANELANYELVKKKPIVFQSENEIAVVNQALGASFVGAITMIGTSGGGFDLMTEGLSMQGQSEIPLMVYLATRPGPSTGIPTYTSQDDLMLAINAGHGEFSRVVVAPGDAIESVEKTNEAIYLAEKFGMLSIILTDKHLAESEFSVSKKINKTLVVKVKRKVPGKDLIKATSYEHVHNDFAETTESAEVARKNDLERIKKFHRIEKEIQKSKYQAVKIYGNRKSKNLVVSFGSTKGAILDAMKNLDCAFLQILYLKPLSEKIKKIVDGKNLILVEQNITGQLGKLLREEFGISILEKNKILKHDGRPFTSDELEKEIRRRGR